MDPFPSTPPADTIDRFRKKVWIVAGIGALSITVLLVLKTAFNILLLVLAGTLIAILFRGTAGYIARKTGLGKGLSLAITLLGTAFILTGVFWFSGARLQSEIATLTDEIPRQIAQAKVEISRNPVGQRILARLDGQGSQIFEKAQGFLSSTFGAVGDLYVILLLALFFTATPMLYVRGMVRLLPRKSQRQGKDVLQKIGSALYKWFAGKLFSMAVVAVLTYVGLLILGVQLALTLALIAGLLSFIPNFGPVIAMIPAALIGLLNGPQDALWVIGLYVLVQVLESNLITPVIQKKLLEIPPALIIVAQLVVGLFSGTVGLIVATPLVVIIMVVVRELYLKPRDETTDEVPVIRGAA